MDSTPGAPASLVEIDGQSINVATLSEVAMDAVARLEAGVGFTLFTLNLDHLVKRRTDPAFRLAYSRATFVTADGAPIVWLAARRGVSLARATGADLVLPLCVAAAQVNMPVAFFGSDHASLDAAVRTIRRLAPNLDVRFVEAPRHGFDPVSSEARSAAARIAQSGARLCFVALGAPKQELFSDVVAAAHPSIGLLGIGAALDFLAGTQRRAPRAVRDLGLEWVWRLSNNPRRLGLRYLRCVGLLADLVLLDPWRRPQGVRTGTSNG